MKKRIGLIGYPIGHSLSPKLFREYFEKYPEILERYSYELVEKQRLEDALEVFEKHLTACNVTAPFKEAALKAAGKHSYRAERCGATNLLVKEGGLTVAYNTDFKAVETLISRNVPARSKVIVVGAGGAGRAAAAAAIECGMRVEMANRTVANAEAFARRLPGFDPHGVGGISSVLPLEDLPRAADSAAALILTLPPTAQLPPLPSLQDKVIIEAVYHQPSFAKVPCLKYISGLEWLKLQAIETYRIILGQDFPEPIQA